VIIIVVVIDYNCVGTPGGSSTVKEMGGCGLCPIFASYTLAFTIQLMKKHRKMSVRVVEKCPDIPVAVAQYTFTHKQCT
jgi:hypothetical protein